jgi:PAS domain S-box-containing protein
MSSSVFVFCPSQNTADEVLGAADELKQDVAVYQAWFPEALDLLKEKASHETKAVMALPVTAKAISENTTIPVVSLNPSSLDLLQAFSDARKYSKEISYIGFFFPALRDALPRIQDFLGVRIQIYGYSKPDQRDEIVHKALQEKTRVAVVTGDQGRTAVEQCGGKAIVVRISRFAILQSLRIVQQIISINEKETRERRWLEILLDLSHDGIVATDAEGKITTFNHTAEKCLGINASSVLGRNINEMESNQRLECLLKFSEGDVLSKEEVIIFQSKHLLVHRAQVCQEQGKRQLIVTFKDESEIERLQRAVHRDAIRRGMVASYTFADIIGHSPAIRTCIDIARIYAATDSTILLTGETGVGKEIFAHSIHNASHRRKGAFVSVNCSTIPENLLESELFGYESGSFTGARKEGKRGLFEYANAGTIFLDEVGEMPLSLQARLLRVLQDRKEIRRVGGDRVLPIDVRVIAATNQDLQREVEAKRFRQDLFHRLNVLVLNILPLRNRSEDIRELVDFFLAKKAAKYKKNPPPINEREIEILKCYEWPGNVRQLEGFIERYVVLCDRENIQSLVDQMGTMKKDVSLLPQECPPNGFVEALMVNTGTLADIEKKIISALLPRYGIVDLAKRLGISRTTVWRKLNGEKNFEPVEH